MSSNFMTLADARTHVKRFVENGSCNTQTIDARINEAVRRLVQKADWVHTTRNLLVRSDNGCFPLPREVERVTWVRIDGNTARLNNKSFEYMDVGPGLDVQNHGGSGLKDLIDDGEHPTMYDMPSIEDYTDAECCTDRVLGEGLYIMAISAETADLGTDVVVYGLDRLNMEIRDGTSPGETIKINNWAGGVEGQITLGMSWFDTSSIRISARKYRQIAAWTKPATEGYVSLYAVEPSTNKMWLLAKAHPDDTRPKWRRYRITNRATAEACSCVQMQVKLKWVEMTRATDVLLIQNLDAIKSMVIAIGAENAGDLQKALNFEQNAERLLNTQLQDHEGAGGSPVVIDMIQGLTGGGMNRYNI